MLFIRNWNKASLDKSSNSIVTRYKGKINSLTDKTEALRKLLGELYDEAITLNERIKIDKQAIQEDLNDTADDLRTTCGNSSWGQEEIGRAQDLLDRAEEDIEDIKTDIEITTECITRCQTGQGAGCSQPSVPCNENTCLIGDAPCNETPEEEPEEPEEEETEEDCVVIVDGEFDCQGTDSYIDNCYSGCFGNQSCDSQTKVCPKCHGSKIDIVETCDNCDTDQKETCGTSDSQAGCSTENDDGNCVSENNSGNCRYDNKTGDCVNNNISGECSANVKGNCDTTNNVEEVDPDVDDCTLLNKEGTNCERINSNGTDCVTTNTRGDCIGGNSTGDCNLRNTSGDCVTENMNGTCQINDGDSYCREENSGDQETCQSNDNGADRCYTENNNGDCSTTNSNGDCRQDNETGNCYTDNTTGNCTTENSTGDCDTQSCEAGQLCTTCIEDQKETSTTEKCDAGANIGEEEYCDNCQGTESKEEEWTIDEITDLCGTIFEGGAEACGTVFANCFNSSECNGSTWGSEIGCGAGEGCGGCDTSDSACDAICDSSQEPVCGTCDTGDGTCTGTCYGGDGPVCGTCDSGDCSGCDGGGDTGCTGCDGCDGCYGGTYIPDICDDGPTCDVCHGGVYIGCTSNNT